MYFKHLSKTANGDQLIHYWFEIYLFNFLHRSCSLQSHYEHPHVWSEVNGPSMYPMVCAGNITSTQEIHWNLEPEDKGPGEYSF